MPAIDAGPVPRDHESTPRSVFAVVGFLVFIELCSGILQGSVPTVVPLIGKQMQVGSGDLNWVNALPLVVSGISVPVFAKLGDIHGHLKMIKVTMVAVAVGSILVAVADTFALLLVGRALTGLFAAWLPLDFAIIRDRVEPKRAGTAIGLLVGALTLGGTLGSIGMGLLSKEVADVQGLLWFPAVAILLCLPVVFFLIPESTSRHRSRIDWPGATLLGVGLGCVLLALARGGQWHWDSTKVVSLFTVGALLLAAFVAVELRASQPLIDVRLVSSRRLAPLYVLSFVVGVVLYGTQTANSTFMATPEQLGFGFGFDTLELALMGLPMGLGAFFASGLADRLLRVAGPRVATSIGFVLFAAAYAVLLVAHSAPWHFAVHGALAGMGLGLVLGTLPTLIMSQLPADQTGIGTGLYNTIKALAGSVSGAVFAAVLNRHLLKLPIPGIHLADEHGYEIVWTISACLCTAGLLFALTQRHADTAEAVPHGAPQAVAG